MRRNKHISQEQIIPTSQGASMSPAQMEVSLAKGLPISSAMSASTFNDGVPMQDSRLDMEFRRGVDIGDLYEVQKSAKLKVKEAYKVAKEQSALRDSFNQLKSM